MLIPVPGFAGKRSVGVCHALAGIAVCLASVFATNPANAQDATSLFEAAEAIRLSATSSDELGEALSLYKKAAELGKHASYYRIGTIEDTLGNHAEAVAAFKLGGESGSLSSLIALAEGHARGHFGDLSDPAQGVPVLDALARESKSQRASYLLASLYESGIGVERDMPRAMALYTELADQGYARALRKLGRFHLKGSSDAGLPQDADRAIDLLKRSVAEGSTSARRDLGLALLNAGRAEDALKAIRQAAASGVPGAQADLANGHYRQLFGALSDKAQGRAQLAKLAEAGDAYAAKYALRHHERKSRRITEMDLPKVLGALEDHADAGSGLAARTLARAYRKLSFLIPDNRAKLATLVRDHSVELGPEPLAAEQVSVLYDKNDHRASRIAVLDYLEGLDGPGYASGALRLRSIERQAYVFLVQKELAARGFYSGPVSGIANRSTIRAILSFCDAQGYSETCIHGPLSFQSSALIMQSLEDGS